MEKRDKQLDESGISLPSCSDLRGRQSVRATFKLTEKAIHTVSIVATHLGIKQKSLFDHLIEDTQSLNLIANSIQIGQFEKLNRVQKTYVLSRKTMTCLGEAAKRFDAPRDALVEYSIKRLLPIIKEERDKHDKRKVILDEIMDHLKQGEKILEKSATLLGRDDPVHDRFSAAMGAAKTAYIDIWNFVEKGKIIEDF